MNTEQLTPTHRTQSARRRKNRKGVGGRPRGTTKEAMLRRRDAEAAQPAEPPVAAAPLLIVVPPEEGHVITAETPLGGYPRPNLDRLISRLIALLLRSRSVARQLAVPTPYRLIAFHGALARMLRAALPLADDDLIGVLTERVTERVLAR